MFLNWLIDADAVFPVCKSGQITTYHVARGELIQIPCEIEAYPTDLIFHWTFNGSRDFADIPGSNYVADRLKSALSYRPVTDQVPTEKKFNHKFNLIEKLNCNILFFQLYYYSNVWYYHLIAPACNLT